MKVLKNVIMKNMINNIFLKLMLIIMKNYMTFTTIYYFYLRKRQKKRQKKIEKADKPVANLHGKAEYVIHIRKLKQALNH